LRGFLVPGVFDFDMCPNNKLSLNIFKNIKLLQH